MLGILMSPAYSIFIRLITPEPYLVTVNLGHEALRSIEYFELVNVYLRDQLVDERAFVYPIGPGEYGIAAFNKLNDGKMNYKRFQEISRMATDKMSSLTMGKQ